MHTRSISLHHQILCHLLIRLKENIKHFDVISHSRCNVGDRKTTLIAHQMKGLFFYSSPPVPTIQPLPAIDTTWATWSDKKTEAACFWTQQGDVILVWLRVHIPEQWDTHPAVQRCSLSAFSLQSTQTCACAACMDLYLLVSSEFL